MKERSLVLFTVLMQAAVGLMMVLSAVLLARYLFLANGFYSIPQHMELPELYYGMVGILAIGGLSFSFFHLGHPGRAYRALLNLRSSSLSQEILFGLLFTLTWAAFWLFLWKWEGSFWVEAVSGFLVLVVGIELNSAMTKVYLLPAAPGWSKKTVLFEFYRTPFVLGPAGQAVLFSVAALNENVIHQEVLSKIAVLGFLLGGTIGGPLQLLSWLSALQRFSGKGRRLLFAAQGLVILTMIGIDWVVQHFSADLISFHPDRLAVLACVLFALAISTEFALRSRFYLLRRPML